MPWLTCLKTIIQISFLYQGRLEDLEPYAAPFRAIGTLSENQHDGVTYPEIFDLEGGGDGPACTRGLYRHQSPTYLMRHNATAMRTVYTLFNDITEKYPDLALNSAYLVEGYPKQGVTAVPSKSTATPYREFPLLL